jgi:hypothetical protein
VLKAQAHFVISDEGVLKAQAHFVISDEGVLVLEPVPFVNETFVLVYGTEWTTEVPPRMIDSHLPCRLVMTPFDNMTIYRAPRLPSMACDWLTCYSYIHACRGEQYVFGK